MSTNATANLSMTGPVIMFVSAALFAYFGFFSLSSNFTNNAGQTVFMWALLTWTLRVGAVAFGFAGVLTFVSPFVGNLVYAIGSGTSALGMAAVGIMDVLDTQHAAALPPVLAFLFAAWNGYGAWVSFNEIMASRRPPRESFEMR